MVLSAADWATIVLAWLALAVLVGWVGTLRGYDFRDFFILSVLSSPIVGAAWLAWRWRR